LKLYWQKGLSASSKHLVKWMFTFDWTKRPDIFEIMKHECLLSKDAAPLAVSEISTEYNLRRRNKIVKTIDYNYDERIKTHC
jgi:hypothetical protein